MLLSMPACLTPFSWWPCADAAAVDEACESPGTPGRPAALSGSMTHDASRPHEAVAWPGSGFDPESLGPQWGQLDVVCHTVFAGRCTLSGLRSLLATCAAHGTVPDPCSQGAVRQAPSVESACRLLLLLGLSLSLMLPVTSLCCCADGAVCDPTKAATTSSAEGTARSTVGNLEQATATCPSNTLQVCLLGPYL